MKCLFLMFAAAALLSAQTQSPFCALDLIIMQPDGSAAGAVTARVMDGEGKQVYSAEVVGGRGAICDLGFGTYSIRLERDGYLPVTLSGIRSTYGSTLHITAVMNPAPDAGSQGGGGNACRAYLRIRTADNQAVPNAEVSLGGKSFLADEFGRVLVLVRVQQFQSLRIEHEGFRPEAVSLGCPQWDQQIERTVVLGRK